MTVAGLVLAAGAGRRMGGPKALLRLAPGAPTLLEQSVCRVRAAGCSPLLVAVGAGNPDLEGLRRAVGADVQIVDVPDWAEGMGASLRSGLDSLAGVDPADVDPADVDPADVEAVLVTLVDLPDVTEEVLRRVLTAANGEGRAALVRAAYRGVPGHPVILGREHWAGVGEGARGDRGARDYLAAREVTLVECSDLATGIDVDRPEDLRV